MVYHGMWSEGKKSDQGVYFYENPHVYYSGGWLNDQKSGEGKLVFPEGEFVGQWRANVRQGQGKMRRLENEVTSIYEGTW